MSDWSADAGAWLDTQERRYEHARDKEAEGHVRALLREHTRSVLLVAFHEAVNQKLEVRIATLEAERDAAWQVARALRTALAPAPAPAGDPSPNPALALADEADILSVEQHPTRMAIRQAWELLPVLAAAVRRLAEEVRNR